MSAGNKSRVAPTTALRPSWLLSALLTAIALVFLPVRMSAQSAGNLSGTVTFNGTAVQGNAASTLYVNTPGAGGTYISTSGGYSFTSVVPGSYTPTVYENGCSPSSILGQAGPFTVAGGGAITTANIELASTAGRVQGTITVNGAGSTSSISVNGLCGQFQTAADGTFTHFLAQGSYTATVNNSSGSSLGTFSFTVTAGQTSSVGSVNLSAGAVSGTVVWNGAAVSTTAVTTMLASIPNVASSPVTSTGTFSLTGVPPGSFNLKLYGNSCSPSILFASASGSVTPGSTSTQNLDITSATGRVSGTITVNGSAQSSPRISISGACQQWQTQTNGTFLQYLLPGSYTATVAATSATIGTFNFTITAGQTTNVGSINFQTGNLNVPVTFAGAAISSPNIAKPYAFVNPGASSLAGSYLDPTQGEFIFNNLPPAGSYTVGIYQNNCAVAAGLLASVSASVMGGSTTTARVELASGAGLVKGTATVNGVALANPQVTISGFCGTWASQSNGTYFQYLPPGTYTAQVAGPSGSLGTLTFTVVAGQTTIANLGATSSATSTSLATSANPASTGQSVTLTSVVSGSYSPVGSVSFYDGNALLAAVQVAGGRAAYTTSSFALGSHAVSAVYGGDSNNATSASPTLTQSIVPPTLASFSVSGYNSPAIRTEGSTITVQALSSGGAVFSSFSGTVTLTSSDAAATLPAPYTFTAMDAGVHAFPVTLNTPGSQSITATSGSGSGTQSGIVVGNAVWVLSASGSLAQFNNAGGSVVSGVGGGGSSSTLGGLAFDSAGDVWSVSTASNTLNFVTNKGLSGTSFTGAGLSTPAAVAVDGAGSLWIVNQGNNSLSLFSNAGAAISGAGGIATKTLSAPTSIAIDSSGNLWITNPGTNSVSEVIGAAAPVTAPLAASVASGTSATKP